MAELTTGDLALMKDDGLGGSNSFMWIFALLILMFGGGGAFGFGGRGPVPAGADQVNQGFTNQQLQQIALSSANNNYETAQLVNAQTNALMQQNNTNLVNAIQGFNQVNLGLQTRPTYLPSRFRRFRRNLIPAVARSRRRCSRTGTRTNALTTLLCVMTSAIITRLSSFWARPVAGLVGRPPVLLLPLPELNKEITGDVTSVRTGTSPAFLL